MTPHEYLRELLRLMERESHVGTVQLDKREVVELLKEWDRARSEAQWQKLRGAVAQITAEPVLAPTHDTVTWTSIPMGPAQFVRCFGQPRGAEIPALSAGIPLTSKPANRPRARTTKRGKKGK